MLSTGRFAGRILALAAMIASGACQAKGNPEPSTKSTIPTTSRPEASSRPLPGTSVAVVATSADAARAPIAPSPSQAIPVANTALDRLPPPTKPLGADCADPRVVLTTRKEFDRSGRLFVQQVLLAFPELQLVTEKASQANQIDVYETIYGYARFARLYPRDPLFSEAVIARCGDVATCNRVAALFEALQPKSKVVLSCGVPPATTGGFARVAELAPERMQLADDKAPRSAVCARIAACSLHESAGNRDSTSCERASLKLGSCSAVADCAEVVRCAGALWK
jgi:hypothetical protein